VNPLWQIEESPVGLLKGVIDLQELIIIIEIGAIAVIQQ